MKKFELLVEDTKAAELTAILENLPYIRNIKERPFIIDPITLLSEQSLSEAWLCEEDDELQRLHGL